MMNIVKMRAIISVILIVVFIIETITGIVLWLSPSGRIAREIGWNFMGVDKLMLENLHTYAGFFMIALVVLHFILNYKMLIQELKFLFKR